MIIRNNLEPICLRKDPMALPHATRTTRDIPYTPKFSLPRVRDSAIFLARYCGSRTTCTPLSFTALIFLASGGWPIGVQHIEFTASKQHPRGGDIRQI